MFRAAKKVAKREKMVIDREERRDRWNNFWGVKPKKARGGSLDLGGEKGGKGKKWTFKDLLRKKEFLGEAGLGKSRVGQGRGEDGPRKEGG